LFFGFCLCVFVVLCVGFVLWKCLRLFFLRFGVLSEGRSFVAEEFFFCVFGFCVCFLGHQGLEEMRHLLMRATLELDSARAVAEAEAEAHEVQVRHLQELLAATQRERDEAREQLLGLQGHLSRSSSMSGRHGSVARTDSLPNSGMFQSVAGEAEQEQQHQQQLDMEKLQQHLELLPDEHLAHLDDTMDVIHHLHLDSATDASSLQYHQHYFDQPSSHDSGSDQLLSHMQQEQLQSDLQSDLQVAFVQQPQQPPVVLDLPELQPAAAADMVTVLQQQPSPWRQQSSSLPIAGVQSSPAAGFSQPLLCSAPALLPSLPSTTSLFQTVSPVVSSLKGIPTHVLPEPPGADLHAMLSTLPEKGKLMQAVMDAGPLLQTLMMASSPSLPQWRHPPPALETLDLPCLSFSSSTSCDSQSTPVKSNALNNNNNNAASIMGMSQPKYGVHKQLQRLSSFSPSASGLASSSRDVDRSLRRVNSMGHLVSPDMALINPPRKYTKIY
jgi:hypothetical protein